MTTVRAFVDTRNIGSVSLLEKLGFSRKKTIENADFFKGNQSDEYEYVLERAAWPAAKSC
ncbi:hypothetical protein AmDm5_0433 [Acetobacter malorum]|nr:hypothetical protein AmDm5_0433 [Acetobacter malorum]